MHWGWTHNSVHYISEDYSNLNYARYTDYFPVLCTQYSSTVYHCLMYLLFSPPPCVYFIPKLYPKLSGHSLNSFTYTWPSSTWVEPCGEPPTCSDPEELLPGLLPRCHLEESFGVSLEVLSLSQLLRCFSFRGQSLALVDYIFQQLPGEWSVV